jgi:hypothetical protein
VFLGGCSHGYLKGEFREWGEERGICFLVFQFD